MRSGLWRVGELAKRTGLSVRALHYYDEIGLLAPSHHSEAGYRLYNVRDVVRLQQIKSLRQLGFSLDEIRDCLSGDDFSPLRVVRLHLTRLREQVELQQRLCQRLEGIAARLEAAEEVSVETFLQTIEAMTMLDKYYTPEQLEEIQERGKQMGEARIRQAETDWQELIAQVREHMEKGTDPASEPVRALAQRWTELLQAFTGGNPEIQKSLNRMWKEEKNIHGMDTGAIRDLWAYLARGNPPADGKA